MSGDCPGIFPICPFRLSRPKRNSTCEEQSRKGPRHNLDLPEKKWETCRLTFWQDKTDSLARDAPLEPKQKNNKFGAIGLFETGLVQKGATQGACKAIGHSYNIHCRSGSHCCATKPAWISYRTCLEGGGKGKGVFTFACQYIVSPHCRTGNHIVTQIRHPIPCSSMTNCAQQSLASTVSARSVAAAWYWHPGIHAMSLPYSLFIPPKTCPMIACDKRSSTATSRGMSQCDAWHEQQVLLRAEKEEDQKEQEEEEEVLALVHRQSGMLHSLARRRQALNETQILSIDSGTGMTGRPGHCKMEMNGRSTTSYLVRTPRIPFCMLIFRRSGSKGAFSFPGATWDRFLCTVGPSPGHIRCRLITTQLRCLRVISHLRLNASLAMCILTLSSKPCLETHPLRG